MVDDGDDGGDDGDVERTMAAGNARRGMSFKRRRDVVEKMWYAGR